MLENAKNPKEAYKLYERAKELKLTNANRHTYERLCRKNFSKVEKRDLIGEVKTTILKDSIENTINTNQKVKDGPADLNNALDMANYCNIDTNLYCVTKYVTNKWGPIDDPYWQVKIWWGLKYKKNEISPQAAVEEFKNLIKDIDSPKFKIKPIDKKNKDLTVLFGLADSHVGALIWGEESSAYNQQNFDIKIAEKVLNKAADYYCNYYINKNVKEFIVPIGGDFLDIDNNENSTINGTIQVVDARPRKIWSVGFRIMKSIIDKLSTIAPVKGLYIPGNHDATVSFYLSVALEAYYHNNPNISINCEPTDRKYLKIGDTLLMITHTKTVGKAIKLEKLVDIMSHEARDLWGKTKNHEIIVEHTHSEKSLAIGVNVGKASIDIGSTIIRVLPTLFPNNYWSNASGFNAVQQMHCLGYNNKNIDEIKIYRP